MKRWFLTLVFLLSLAGTAFAETCMTVVCDTSGNLDAGYIGTGTIPVGRLPLTDFIHDTVYGSGWGSITDKCPSAKVIYDKIETLGSPAGDIEAIWGCTSGNCNVLTAASGDSLNALLADSSKPFKELADCSIVIGDKECCITTSTNAVCCGNGATCVPIAPVSMAIGGAVGGGATSGSVPYIDSSGNLAQENASFNYDPATNTFTADIITTTGSDPKVTAANSDGPASPTAGDMWIDTTATYGQLGFYDAAVSVIDPRVLLPLSYPSPVGSTSQMVAKMPYGIVIRSINCIIDPAGTGESVVMYLDECDSSGDNCAGIDGATTISCGNAGAADDGSLSNATVDANDWIKINFDAVTGTVSTLGVTVVYTVVNE